MIAVTFYDPETGALGRTYTGPESQLASNTPPGQACVAGVHDAATCRVRMVADEAGQLQPVVEPIEAAAAVDLAAEAARVRAARNVALRECDWVTAVAVETGEPVPDAWKVYRQALRDITDQPGFPVAVAWPTSPHVLT